MNQLMGWCQSAAGTKPDAHHNLCPGTYKTQVGVTVVCSCPAHNTSVGDASTPESGKMGAKNEPPIAYLAVRNRGLSPTTEESTSA